MDEEDDRDRSSNGRATKAAVITVKGCTSLVLEWLRKVWFLRGRLFEISYKFNSIYSY